MNLPDKLRPGDVRILIAEDSPTQAEQLRQLLAENGFAVSVARNGREALTAALAQPPTLLITDIVMPEMDGYELCAAIKSDDALKDIPVVMVTSLAGIQDIAKSLECGADNFIRKPYDPNNLLRRIEYILLNLELRKSSKLKMGMEIFMGGRKHFVSSGREQIVDMLIATYEEAVHMNAELQQQQQEIELSNRTLRGLFRIAGELNRVASEAEVCEQALRSVVELPGLRAGWIFFTDGAGGMRTMAACNLPEPLLASEALEGDCRCRRMLRAGELRRGALVVECERLEACGGEVGDVRCHVSVPLTVGSQQLGIMNVVGDESGAFGTDDLRMLEAVGSQVAIAIQRAQLYQHLEAMVEQRTAALQAEIVERTRAQEEVQIREEQFHALAETAVDAIVTADAGGRIVFANRGAQRTFGYSVAEMLGQPVQALMPERYRRGCTQGIERYLHRGESHVLGRTVEHVALRKDGAEFPIDLSLASWRSREQVFFTAIIRDISERREQQEKIARLSRIQGVLSGINSAIVRLHEPLALFNEACRVAVEAGQFGMALIGLLDADGQGGRFVAGIGPQAFVDQRFPVGAAAPAGQCPVGQALCSQRAAFCNDIALTSERGLFLDAARAHGYRSLIALPLLRDQASVGVLVLYAGGSGFFDAKELRLLDELAGDLSFALEYIAKAEQLDYLVYYDALTGLPNRSLLHDRLQQLLTVQAEHGGYSQVALLLLNIERFKNINDTFGRHSGDTLLKQIAARLSAALGSSDRLARLGSDHFAAIVGGFDDAADVARRIDDSILASFARPFEVNGTALHMTLKIGVVLFPSDGRDADTLFANAETALRKAATAGERYLFYAPQMNAHVSEQLTLENKLRGALERGEFVLHYQPKVSLKNGEVVGLEALIRWQDPATGLVPPDDFIPLLEETGMIVEVGRWALEQALADCCAWHADGVQLPRVAVNVSAVQLRRKDFLETIQTVLARHGGERNYLDLELTESVLMADIETSVRCLGAVRKLGVKIAVDDFGTGYSSLSYLKRFPIDYLKIDQSFVRDITTDPDAAAICIAVIGLAHNLKMKVIAEGVETEGQMNYLRRHDCDEMQGYLFSRPLPADQCALLLQARKTLALPPAADGEQKTLLIVDDEPSILSALKRVLRRGGYEILTAESAREGFELLATHPVQVILSDQRMPAMSGTEFLSRVSELYPDTIRIVLSGYTDLDSITGAINRGAIYRFLTKPWEDEQLREHVREAFRHQAAARRKV